MKKLVFKAVLAVMLASGTISAQFTPPVFGWVIHGANTGNFSFADGIKCDNLGNVYVTGRYAGNFNYSGMMVGGGGATPIFNAKLNATTGAGIWLNKAFATGGFDYPCGAHLDNAGNLY